MKAAKKSVKKPVRSPPGWTVDNHIDPIDQQLHDAVQAKLIALATKPVTPRSLLEMEQMTRILRQLVAIGMDPMSMKRREHGAVYQTWQQQQSAFPSEDVTDLPPMPMTSPGYPINSGSLAPSPPAENWGATVLRELMTLLGNKKSEGLPVPVVAPPQTELDKLIDSIAYAREKGLKDVEETLMKQLVKMEMDKKKPPQPPIDFYSAECHEGVNVNGAGA